jgi:arginine deiminase
VRGLYREYRDLGKLFKAQRKHFEFAADLRNKLVVHLCADLITKAIEWRQELQYLVH